MESQKLKVESRSVRTISRETMPSVKFPSMVTQEFHPPNLAHGGGSGSRESVSGERARPASVPEGGILEAPRVFGAFDKDGGGTHPGNTCESMKSADHFSSRSGMALVVVLSMLALVTIIAVAFSFFSLYQSRNARNFLLAARGDFLTQAALSDAMSKIIAGTPQVGSHYYWVSAPGRIWRVGGVNTLGATNPISSLSPDFVPNYATNGDGTPDLASLHNQSGYLNLFSENAANYTSALEGFGTNHFFVDLNSSLRGRRIAPDTDPTGTGSGSPIRLPVAWVEVTRDVTRPKQATNPAAANYNPVIGRYAYWVDVDNARLNINDIHERPSAWRGLSPRELDARVLDGITPAVLDGYRSPDTVAGLWNEEARNQNYFRRAEDLRLAGVTPEVIRTNSFYLTAAGRGDEVDNAGRIPLKITDYNGHPTNVSWPSGFGTAPTGFTNNHPMATWNIASEAPALTSKPYAEGTTNIIPGGTVLTTNPGSVLISEGPYSDGSEVQFWRDATNSPPNANNPLLINGVLTFTGISINYDDLDDIYNITATSNWAQEVSVPSDPVTNVTDASIAANYFLPSSTGKFTNSQDWLPTRLIATNAGGFTADVTNRARIALQRLTQVTNPATAPAWFVATTPTSTNGQGGKYTWNEFSQILANINTWRQTNLVARVKPFNYYLNWNYGPFHAFTYRNDVAAGNLTNAINSSVGFAPPTTTLNGYTVVENQNLGSRPLPYVNEVGLTIDKSGHSVSRVTLHLELWNPALPAPGTTAPYSLGIVVAMPETYSPGGQRSDSVATATNAPNRNLTNGTTISFITNGASEPLRIFERWNSQIGYEITMAGNNADTFYTDNNVVPDINTFPLNIAAGFWARPGFGNKPFDIKGRTPQADDLHFPGIGGGTYGWDQNSRIAQLSFIFGRWHLPFLPRAFNGVDRTTALTLASGADHTVFYISNAHLVDWRIPQHVDISLMPRNAWVSEPLSVEQPFWGGYTTVTNGQEFNFGVAVGLFQVTSPVSTSPSDYAMHGVGIPSLAAGPITTNAAGTLYQIVPHPRINPGDVTGGLPQTKFLIFPDIISQDGRNTYTREVDDPRVNGRATFIDWRLTGSSERNNLVNTYDANDWGPVQRALNAGAVSGHSLPTLNVNVEGIFDNFDGVNNVDNHGINPVPLFETATGPLLTIEDRYFRGELGMVGRTNRALVTQYSSEWTRSGTNWTDESGMVTGAKPIFSGLGDGDGDLTSHLYKQGNYEHPAELGYVHSGRPWRTLRFGRSVTNDFDTANSVPDWYLFDQFLSSGGSPDAAGQEWSRISTNRVVGLVTNPRRGQLSLNNAIHTADTNTATSLTTARLKPLLAVLTNVVANASLYDVARAVYMPGSTNITGYTGYTNGPTGDRFGIPGVIDSPGELSEVFGRFDNSVALRSSAPYTMMVTNVWGGASISLTTDSSAHTVSGAQAAFDSGWSGAGFSGGAVTLSGGNSAFPKELLRAVGLHMSPRTSHFRIYILAQSLNDQGKITGEKWKEVLVERFNNYNESGQKPEYRIIWEKSL